MRHPLLVRILAVALPLATAGCAAHLDDGALTPRPARTTNETRAVDLRVFDMWNERLLALMTSAPTAAPDERQTIATLAAADAWLAFARDEYLREPRSVVVDEVFTRARAAIEAIEQGRTVPTAPLLVTGTTRAHEELWARYADVQGHAVDPALLAETAVLLVRAGRVPAPGETTVCDPAPFVARARDNLALLVAATKPVPPALTVTAAPRAERRQVAVRSVYFALDSDAIGPAGREMLDGLLAALQGHHGVTIELQGFADPRGSSSYNVALSRRRATAVQQYLAARTFAVTAFEITPLGRARAEADLSDRVGLARDRRVDLRVILPDGTEARRAESLETDLQVEAERRAARVGGAPRASRAP